jgi:DNA-binding GntR family transcriptional regulator
MDILEKIFGDSTHLEIILLFYDNPGYFTNITKLADTLDKSHVTVRKAISDLVTAGIITELDIGKSRVIRINEKSPYTGTLFNFIDTVRSVKEKRSIEDIIAQRTAKAASKAGAKS